MSYNNNQEETSCPCKRIPLHLSSFTAAEYGDIPALRQRLSSSSKSQQKPIYDAAGNTPLHFAAQHGHTELVAMLLSTGVYNDMYNKINNNTNNSIVSNDNSSSQNVYVVLVSGVTPLHRACFSGATSAVRLLLDHILTIRNNNNTVSSILSLPDTSFNDFKTPLHKCASGGRYLVVQLLLDFIFQHGGDRPTIGALLSAKDANGRTPLDVACEKQRHRAEHQSVQRWDAIAGGHADWDVCVQLLSAAQYKVGDTTPISTSTTSIVSDKLIPPTIQMFKSVCSDINCGDGRRQCTITASWEQSFQAALLGSVIATCKATPPPSNGNFEAEIKANKLDGVHEEHTRTIGTTIASSARTGTTISTKSRNIGSLCSDCGIACIVLMPSRSNPHRLVCTKCRRVS